MVPHVIDLNDCDLKKGMEIPSLSGHLIKISMVVRLYSLYRGNGDEFLNYLVEGWRM